MKRLLDRQNSLLTYLTSPAAVFGEVTAAACDNVLGPIDPTLLRLEARFSFEKRMAKIAAVMPLTFAFFGVETPMVAEFVASCPPHTLASIENARQFHDFLVTRWRREPPVPPYLPDIAACEMACADVRSGETEKRQQSLSPTAPGSIRRRPGIRLQRCGYDVRPIFENAGTAEPLQRETLLAVALAPETNHVVIAELAPRVFGLLAALDDFTDPKTFNDVPNGAEIIAALSANGLIEASK